MVGKSDVCLRPGLASVPDLLLDCHKKEVACKVGSYPLRSTLDGEKVARLFIIKTGTPLIVLGEYLTISRGPHSVMGKLGHMITLEWYKP